MRFKLIVVAIVFALFGSVSRAAAQTPIPPERTGTVTGQIVNGSSGSESPGNLALMLHAWDTNGETVMLDGTADASGAFQFNDVRMQDGWVFAAMVAYKDVTFFSASGEVGPDTQELDLPLTVYESTLDDATVLVSQLHAFLEVAQGELVVGEVYVLSNSSDRVVKGGLLLPDGQAGTLLFALPPGANKVSFKDNDNSARFVLTPGGFADTGPVLPGEGSTQVIVRYTLPYSPGMAFAHAVNYPVEMTNGLLPSGSGLTLSAPGLSAPAPREIGNGEAFDVYSLGPLASGDSLAFTLNGEPSPTTGNSGAVGAGGSLSGLVDRWAVPIGGGALGLTLIGLGVWWWRRSRPEEVAEAEPGMEWEEVLRSIAALDAAHERGEVSDEEHRARRAALKETAREILLAEEGEAQ